MNGHAPHPDPPLVAAALELAASGVPVFPCGPDKRPIVSTGFQAATTNPAIVRRMFEMAGARLIGVPTGEASGLDVLDFDYRHGADAFEAANILRLPETRIHQTMSGGRHLVFAHDARVRNSAGRVAPGVDVRGAGGYIIVPPSPGYSVISMAPIVPWPDWLLTLALRPEPDQAKASKADQKQRPARDAYPRTDQLVRRHQGYVARLLQNIRDAHDGEKHNVLLRQARALGGIMAAAGVSESDALAWLLAALPDTVEDWGRAKQTALDGLRHGQLSPFDLEERHGGGFGVADEAAKAAKATKAPGESQDESGTEDGVGNDIPHPESEAGTKANGYGSLEALTPTQIGLEQPRDYVLKGLIARGDHVIAMGSPGSGKSVFGPYVGYAVAQGRSVFGRRVRQGPVLYLASEDGHGMKGRVRALLQKFGDAPDFWLVSRPVNLLDDVDQVSVKALIAFVQPALIFIDTLSRCYPGLRENESADMSLVVMSVRDLSAICQSAVWLIHHVAKDGGRTPRGHGSLDADADLTMLIGGSGSETRTISLGKNRNGPSDTTFSFGISVASLGIDDDGDAIAVPIAFEDGAPPRRPRPRAPLTDRAADLLHILRNADPALFEEVRPVPGMAICLAMRREKQRQVCIDAGWFPDGLLCDALHKAKPTRPALTMESNALIALRRRELINFNRAWVWLI